ncbi:MAG: hypothetical protein M3R65_01830 [Gemmatimonadota bacterium]|nr:hypothetical protein [Gemmatimonadota bacterium]
MMTSFGPNRLTMLAASGVSALAALGAALSLSAPTIQAQIFVEYPLAISTLPTYDRVDGLSVPVMPSISIGENARFVVNPALTYRSNLGKVDPSLAVTGQFTADSSIGFALSGARGTFTNERWIRSDLINSLVSFGLGHDSRNYFRGDRGEARLTSSLASVLGIPVDVASVFIGGRIERDWSTGWQSGVPRGPYSILGRSDTTDGIRRRNPAITAGHIASAIAGLHGEYTGAPGAAMLDVLLEAAGKSPSGGNFQQLTIDAGLNLATWFGQRVEIGSHLVTTTTNTMTPLQRFAYVGGSGSLATISLLGLGGDHLYFTDVLYVIPIAAIDLPLVGSPYIAPHFAAGAASVGGFGRPVENIGGRVGVSVFTLDYLVNPRTHQHDFGAGISLRP